MCFGVPGEIKSIEGKKALVDVGGVSKTVRIDAVEDVEVGSWVLSHAGFAIRKIPKEEAEKTVEMFNEFLRER